MTLLLARCFVIVNAVFWINGQSVTFGPPKVNQNPIYLDSYVPAAMQVIAHLTDLMKYEIKPTQKPTTTAPPSTSSHMPGLYAPTTPSAPKHDDFVKLGEIAPNKEFPSFNRFKSDRNFLQEELDLFGILSSDLYKLVNTNDRYDFIDDDVEIQKFSENYDDDFGGQLRQKKIPPTKAYVTLLSLYDNLNKEAKKLNLNKYSGYSKKVLEDLADTSTGTSSDQLHEIMTKILERRDVTQTKVVSKVETLKKDLEQNDSYINLALRYIPPLAFDIFTKGSLA